MIAGAATSDNHRYHAYTRVRFTGRAHSSYEPLPQ
jgi:hypothetical protein